MAAVNKVILVGHLGRDPEVRYTPDGRAICNFTMATTDTDGCAASAVKDALSVPGKEKSGSDSNRAPAFPAAIAVRIS